MKPPKFMTRERPSTEMVLQITSMADIFIILLVFLLKCYSSGSFNIAPGAGTRLPQAIADGEQTEALKVEISEHTVQVDDRPVSELQRFRFPSADLQPQTGLSRSLDEALRIARQRQEVISRTNPEVRSDERILVLADSRTPYQTVKTVALTAAVHGFGDLKLVVVKKQ